MLYEQRVRIYETELYLRAFQADATVTAGDKSLSQLMNAYEKDVLMKPSADPDDKAQQGAKVGAVNVVQSQPEAAKTSADGDSESRKNIKDIREILALGSTVDFSLEEVRTLTRFWFSRDRSRKTDHAKAKS